MQPQSLSQPKSPLKSTRIIYFALLAGQCLFMLVELYITPSKGIGFSKTDPMIYIALALALVAVFVGPLLGNKILAGAAEKTIISEKIKVYQASFIRRGSLFNGTIMFSIVSYSITGNLFYILLGSVMILVYLSLYPSNDKVLSTLGLTTADLEPELQ